MKVSVIKMWLSSVPLQKMKRILLRVTV